MQNMENPERKVITTANASQCTPYELRQELIRRNAFDIDEKHANYRSMLQRLMVELVKEEETLVAERLKQKEFEALQLREKAKEERERKKQEALEKSRQRREQDPDYLKKKAIIPELPKEVSIQPIQDEDEEKEGNDEDEDVFRAYKNNARGKVFVK